MRIPRHPGARFAAAALLALTALALISLQGSAISIQPHTSAGEADYTIAGNPGDLLPSSISAGNWTRDNRSDVLVCSTTNRTCWIFFGTDAWMGDAVMRAPDVTIVGLGGSWGASASFVGDLNGDGLEDVAIGAPDATGVGGVLQGGSVWLFFSRGNSFNGSIGYYDANATIFGIAAGDRLGASITRAGDVDADGFDDLWVGAPNHTEGPDNVGAVYLFRGGAAWPTELSGAGAAYRLLGAARAGQFGKTLAGGADLNGDGRPDLIVASSIYPDASAKAVGAAFAFLAPFATDGRTENATRARATFWGNALVPSLGASVAAADNFTAEGGRVIFVGASAYTNSTRSGGAVYIFQVTDWTCCRSLNTWDAAGMIFTEEPGDSVGASLAAGADINHDGYPDLVVGAPGADVTGSADVGRASLVYGKDVSREPFPLNATNSSVDGIQLRSQLGALVLLCDFNGDGWADVFASAPNDNSGGNNTGAVYGFLGRPRNREPTVRITVTGDLLEGSPIQLTANVVDPDHDQVSIGWDLSGNAASTSYNSAINQTSAGVVFYDEGTYSVGVQVSDGEFRVAVRANLSVANAPPNCTISSPSPFIEGKSGAILLDVRDPGLYDTLTVRWFGPPGLSNSTYGASYKPPRGQTFNVSVEVRDNDGGAGSCRKVFAVQNVGPTVSLSGPTTLNEGDTGNFAATVVDPGTGDEFNYTWFGVANEAASGPFLAWMALGPGNFTVRVHVEDLDGGYAEAALAVRVLNVPPNVWLDVPRGAVEGQALNITVQIVSGFLYDRLAAVWNFCAAGQADGLVLHVSRAVPGEWCVEARVADDDDSVTVLRETLVVSNRAPLSDIRTTPPGPFQEGQRITFDPVAGPWETTPLSHMKFTWFVDGTNVSTGTQMYLTAPAGRHRVSVLAFDRDGASSRINVTIDVDNVAPLVKIYGNSTIAAGETGTWSAVATDPSGKPVTLHWQLDGQPVSSGPNVTWTARGSGAHLLQVTAQDGDGGITITTLVVTVVSPEPIKTQVDSRYFGILIGGAAAFAAGIILGAFAVGWIKQRRLRE